MSDSDHTVVIDALGPRGRIYVSYHRPDGSLDWVVTAGSQVTDDPSSFHTNDFLASNIEHWANACSHLLNKDGAVGAMLPCADSYRAEFVTKINDKDGDDVWAFVQSYGTKYESLVVQALHIDEEIISQAVYSLGLLDTGDDGFLEYLVFGETDES